MHNEQVFTPEWVVLMMTMKLYGTHITGKHIIDNSCGDGAFLHWVVVNYIQYFIWEDRGDRDKLKKELETYIHGIEIDENLCKKCVERLDKYAAGVGIHNVNWDIKCADALTITEYDGKMDYVIGNPPYVNVHDFGDNYEQYKSSRFIDKGMADLYLVFFDKGIEMLKDTGKLMYITPSSWTTSMAGHKFREWILENKTLQSVIDMGHAKVFENANTYTMVTTLTKTPNARVDVFEFVEEWKFEHYQPYVPKDSRSIDSFECNGNFYFNTTNEQIENLRKIMSSKRKDHKIHVKNGLATLNDKLFVIEGDLEQYNLEIHKDNVRGLIKASNGEKKHIIYPYDYNGNPLSFETLTWNTMEYLLKRCKELSIKQKGTWWLYGRSQAIKDVPKMKMCVNNLIRNKDDLKINMVQPHNCVYSGFYITVDEDFAKQFKVHPFKLIHFALESDEFENYVKLIGKYKNGGYYTFSTKEIENFLNFFIKT